VAQRGRVLSGDLAAACVRVARANGIRAASRLLGLNRSTVQKYCRGAASQPAPAAGGQGPVKVQHQGQDGSAGPQGGNAGEGGS
jgi:hypothetical protein